MPAPRRALLLRLDPELLAKVDAARGHLSRSAWVRGALIAYTAAEHVKQHGRNVLMSREMDWQALVNSMPATIPRAAAADIISAHLFPITHRAIERWPLPKVRGAYGFTPTVAVFRIALTKATHGGRYGRMPELRDAEGAASSLVPPG